MVKEIKGIVYEVVDALTDITIADSLVVSSNKIGTGNGERKLYVGNENDTLKDFLDNFTEIYHCFMLKSDLETYLKKVKKEYLNPRQEYRKKDEFPQRFFELQENISKEEEHIFFDMFCSDVERPRIYINAVGKTESERAANKWNLIREISLPNVTSLSIMKLKKEGRKYFYFKLEADFEILGIDIEEEIWEEEQKIRRSAELSPVEKQMLYYARIGQGKYRKQLLEEISCCPFTLVDDKHLLIASHIKPWKNSTNEEKLDPKNGFAFTPTYDRLFDQGYISFTDNKELLVSPWLSKANISRLNLEAGMVIAKLPGIDDTRKRYLAYHRKNIFKN